MNTKTRGQSGQEVLEVKAIGLKLTDSESQTIADAGTATYLFTEATGLFLIVAGTSTAIFGMHDNAGTPTSNLISGTAATFTATADNAGTINVYWDTTALVVQNNSGGSLDITVKAIL